MPAFVERGTKRSSTVKKAFCTPFSVLKNEQYIFCLATVQDSSDLPDTVLQSSRPPPCFYQVDIDVNHVKKSPLGASRPFGVPFKFPCNAMYMYSTRYVYMHNAIKGSVKCYAVSSMKWMLGWGEDKSPLQEGSKAKNSYHICYKILKGVMAQRRLRTWRS